MTKWHKLINSAWQWLYPGLKIKRWILLAALGLCASLLGFTLLVGPDLYQSGKAIAPLLNHLRGSVYSGIILAAGLIAIVVGLQRATAAAGKALTVHRNRPLIEALFTKRYLETGPRVVTIGGGTGLSVLLRELKNYTSNITAVVAVSDDGGSSGRLRGELGILPPGDIRACILAMADTEPLMEKLFQHRFAGGKGLAGHSFGNLFIAAMTEMFGFQEAVKFFGQVLAIRGQVFPVTLDLVQLESEDASGRRIIGEAVLNNIEGPLKRISLLPPDVQPLPEVLAAIDEAEAIVLGPGSLFTSIMPNLLVPGVVDALRESKAIKFYVCNVMTQPGETTGFTAADHVHALLAHTVPELIDYVIVNSDLTVPREKLAPFHQKGSVLVRPDYGRLRELNARLISAPLINHHCITRHNARRLTQVIVEQVSAGFRQRRGGSLENRIQYINRNLRRRISGI